MNEMTQAKAEFTALILAGRRGPKDELAEATGSSHRALLDVCGTPMMVRVLDALRASPSVHSIAVSIDDPDALEGLEGLGEVIMHRSLSSPSRSVRDFLESRSADEPILVVTADHALLTPAMVEHFIAEAQASDADVLVALVEEKRIKDAYPETTRTYLRFRGEGFSGANLFMFKSERARNVATFWIRAESFRKQPWRLVSAFGPVALLLFLLRRLDLDAALVRASRGIGAKVKAIRMPFAEAAIDVDRKSDLELVTEILENRKSSNQYQNQDPDLG
jgi:GTP:adenosylcobinamide-phosphate guanylyltransferase